MIIGGGPAGTSTAIALASSGAQVTLVDRARFPRTRIGESLPPKIEPLLAALGVTKQVEQAQFARMRGTTIVQGASIETHEFDPTGGALGYQVERERFDALLLDRAREMGVEVREETAFTRLERDSEKVTGVSLRSAAGENSVLAAKMVVDASGVSAIVSRALGSKRREAIRTVALCGYWKDTAIPADIPASNTLFETFADGWLWSVRRADGLRNVTLAFDTSSLRGVDTTAYYLDRARNSALIAPLLKNASLAGEVAAHDATWFDSEKVCGDGWILVGDAASFIDPLTSQGVFKAIQSGLAAAAVIRTIMQRPEDTELARRYYQESQEEFHANYVDVALAFYRESPFAEEPFWKARTSVTRRARARNILDDISQDDRRDRRNAFVSTVGTAGGKALEVTRDPRLELARAAVIERGLVIEKPRFALEGRVLPTAPATSAILPDALWPLLDGRPLESVFESYAGVTQTPVSSDLGRGLMNSLTQLVELGLVHWRVRGAS